MFSYTNDPEYDAEKAQEDPRPIWGHCPICGEEIHGACDGWEADEAYDFDGECVCYECLHEYLDFRRIDR